MKTGLNHAVRVTVAALSIVLGLGAAVPAAAQCPGDCYVDGLNRVDGADLALLLGRWGEVGPSPADVNADGLVDGRDLSVVLGAWGPCSPVVSTVSPNVGAIVGGTTVTISGAYFTGTTAVAFGGTPATQFSIVDSTTLTAVTPAAVVGAVEITVTANGRVGSLSAAYTFVPVVVPTWATLIEAQPDPAVVWDADLRAAITATGLAWRVKDTATQMEFVLIPPGNFEMGCSASELFPCFDNEYPKHPVTLTNAFYLGRYEVTQAQWQARMGSNPSFFQSPSSDVPADQVPNRPVERVSWNMIAGAGGFMAQTGMRLPTEAEWEFAYRAGTTRAFHGFTGYLNGTNNESLAGNIAWYGSNSNSQTRPVGGKAGNGFGLHDMSGNVWEWVNDRYSDSYYASSPAQNPPGPASGSSRVFRGGSWYFLTNYLRASARNYLTPGATVNDIGCRAARNP